MTHDAPHTALVRCRRRPTLATAACLLAPSLPPPQASESSLLVTLRREVESIEQRLDEERAAHSATRKAGAEREQQLDATLAESAASLAAMQRGVEERAARLQAAEERCYALEHEVEALQQRAAAAEARVAKQDDDAAAGSSQVLQQRVADLEGQLRCAGRCVWKGPVRWGVNGGDDRREQPARPHPLPQQAHHPHPSPVTLPDSQYGASRAGGGGAGAGGGRRGAGSPASGCAALLLWACSGALPCGPPLLPTMRSLPLPLPTQSPAPPARARSHCAAEVGSLQRKVSDSAGGEVAELQRRLKDVTDMLYLKQAQVCRCACCACCARCARRACRSPWLCAVQRRR